MESCVVQSSPTAPRQTTFKYNKNWLTMEQVNGACVCHVCLCMCVCERGEVWVVSFEGENAVCKTKANKCHKVLLRTQLSDKKRHKSPGKASEIDTISINNWLICLEKSNWAFVLKCKRLFPSVMVNQRGCTHQSRGQAAYLENSVCYGTWKVQKQHQTPVSERSLKVAFLRVLGSNQDVRHRTRHNYATIKATLV